MFFTMTEEEDTSKIERIEKKAKRFVLFYFKKIRPYYFIKNNNEIY